MEKAGLPANRGVHCSFDVDSIAGEEEVVSYLVGALAKCDPKNSPLVRMVLKVNCTIDGYK